VQRVPLARDRDRELGCELVGADVALERRRIDRDLCTLRRGRSERDRAADRVQADVVDVRGGVREQHDRGAAVAVDRGERVEAAGLPVVPHDAPSAHRRDVPREPDPDER
jgi:hypothetical protein